MSETVYVRRPFLILPYSQRNIAVPKELMFDHDNNIMYVRSIDGLEDIPIANNVIIDNLLHGLEKILGGVREDGNTFKKIKDAIDNLQLWKDNIDNSDPDHILNIIFEKLEGISEPGLLLEMLNEKVDKIEDMQLSSKDFTDTLFIKLNEIETDANKYIHPTNKVCNYEPTVKSVNGKIGENIIITKEDLGLGGVEPGANRYIHPTTKQCNAECISSINGKTGSVILNKSDLGLEKLENYDIAIEQDILNKASNKYSTPSTFKMQLDKYIEDNPGIIMVKLTFIITPSDAIIKVNNVIWTDNSQRLNKGFYYYEISKTGYSTITGDIYMECDRTINISLVKSQYSVNITTIPTEAVAEVYYNNKWINSKYHMLPNGTYNYRVYVGKFEPELSSLYSISAVVSSNYIIYKNQTIDKTKITVTAKYVNDTTKIVTNFNISPTSFGSTGNQLLNITYTENDITKSTTLLVIVQELIILNNINATYTGGTIYTGTTINKSDLSVYANYTDSSSRKLSSSEFSITPTSFSTTGNHRITVSYTEGNITKTAETQEIVVRLSGGSSGSEQYYVNFFAPPSVNINVDTNALYDVDDFTVMKVFENIKEIAICKTLYRRRENQRIKSLNVTPTVYCDETPRYVEVTFYWDNDDEDIDVELVAGGSTMRFEETAGWFSIHKYQLFDDSMRIKALHKYGGTISSFRIYHYPWG